MIATTLGDAGPTCLFRRVTGVPCPTCGSTRGTLSLLAGRPSDAVRANPLVFGLLVIAALLLVFRFVTGRRVRFGLTPRERRVAVTLALILTSAGWAYTIRTIS